MPWLARRELSTTLVFESSSRTGDAETLPFQIPPPWATPFGPIAFPALSLDRKMARARALQDPDPKRAAALWQEIDHHIVDLALWVPYVSGYGVEFVSARVGNYHFHPVWGFLADQAWLR